MDYVSKVAENLDRIIAERGKTRRSVSLEAGLSHTAVRNIILGTSARPSLQTLTRVARVLDVDLSEILGSDAPNPSSVGHTAVVGRVGAGALVPLVDDFSKGDGLYTVITPPQLGGKSVVAVEVTGDSMAPMYQPGDVLFYQRTVETGVLQADVGKPCVVCDGDGNAWVKLLKRGTSPGLWHLISLNPSAESVWDVQINWAARILMALPVDFVEKGATWE